MIYSFIIISSIDNNNNNNSFKLEGKRNYTQLKQQQREEKFKKEEEKRYSTKNKKKEKKKIQNKKNKQKKTSSVLKPSIGEVTLPSKLQKKCLVQRDIKYMGSVFSNRSWSAFNNCTEKVETSEELLNKITTENLYHTKRLQASWYGSTLEEKKKH